jgi:ABC-2 type transport system ATP-binding protein
MLRRGRIVDEGSPDGLLARYDRDTMEDVFLDIARGRGQGAESRGAETVP